MTARVAVRILTEHAGRQLTYLAFVRLLVDEADVTMSTAKRVWRHLETEGVVEFDSALGVRLIPGAP